MTYSTTTILELAKRIFWSLEEKGRQSVEISLFRKRLIDFVARENTKHLKTEC